MEERDYLVLLFNYYTWVGEKLKELEAAEGKERCAAALARYRALENEVYAQLETEEKRVSARACAGS